MRGSISLIVLSISAVLFAVRAAAEDPAPAESSTFDVFLAQLWPDAQSRGISRPVFDKAFAGVMPDRRVIAATRKQPEYGKPIGAYVNAIASNDRIEAGRRKAQEIAGPLGAVERKYGIDRWIIVAIWGIETSFGTDKDHFDVIRSLATLAQAGYRDPYFRNELLVALTILQEGSVPRERLVGAWAGAMGQPQFMPSNYIDYAVKFSGHGRGDIWTNAADVVASIGNYLKKERWKSLLVWGVEVVIPKDFDYRRPSVAAFQRWSALGLKAADGRPMPKDDDAILFFPTGASGPAFLVTKNFNVIKRYNDSDVYALAVGVLADRLRGLGPVHAEWPAGDRQMSRDERIALQRKLSGMGYAVHDLQGHIDFDLRDAIRDVQSKLGMVPDGHPTAALLDRLDEANR
jgi:membrane-bound lytic murein transglycosylase B